MKKMKTKHAPYSLYKKKVGTRKFWYARFWNPREKAYTAHRATGVEASGARERRAEAEKAANAMLPEICFSAAHLTLAQYLDGFWKKDSPYFKEFALTRKKEAAGAWIDGARSIIDRHIAPYPPFASMKPEQLTAGVLRDFRLWLSERGLSGSRINSVMQVIRIPVRYAADRDETRADPFSKIRPAAETRREKGVLAPEEVAALANGPAENTRNRLAVLLGALCGLRLGEVRGLCWEDIEDGLVRVRHNWQNSDGMKGPKLGSFRDVPLPRPVRPVLEAYRAEKGGPRSGLVFEREKGDGQPLSNGFFRLAANRELAGIGIAGVWTSLKKKPDGYVNEQKERNITFHSLRHTFVSLMRLAGATDFETQALAGHRSSQMMDRYSHPNQITDAGTCQKRLEDFLSAL
jgi:integrase